MEYDIKLSGTPFDDGGIDLDRLELLAQYLRDIAKGALQIRLFGTSIKKGRETEEVSNALRIRLKGLNQGSTVLHLECQPFKETIHNVQGSLFQQEILNRLPDQTPIGLVMETFADALNPESDGNLLDKNILKDLNNFKKLFINETQVLQISNRESLPALNLRIEDFSRLRQIEEQIPDPQQVVISGLVEELKFSKAKVTFIPDKGSPITGFLGETLPAAGIAKYWGEKVTIRGIAHFRPNGQMAFVEIATVFLAESSDAFFSRPVRRETVAQQIERQLQEKGSRNRMTEFIGILEDAEGNYESDLKMLQE